MNSRRLLAYLVTCAAAGCGNDTPPGDPSTSFAGSAGREAATESGASPGGAGGSEASKVGGAAGALVGSAGAPQAGSSASGGRATSGSGGAESPGTAGKENPSAGASAVAGSSGAGGASSAGAAGASGAECGRCSAYAAAKETGQVEPSELDALSGLAVSRAQPDILFAHNDHERAVVYALDLAGREHARITLEGASATDIEDIAVGPCGTETCVYLADIGDNNARRTEYAVLRFAEPTVPASAGSMPITAAFERFRFTYEDGSHNAESFMVAPDGALYVVTKLAPGSGGNVPATGPSSVYRLPASITTDSVARATKIATLTVPLSGEGAVSAAAAHPCGQGFLLRTYDRVYEFLTPAGMGFEAAFSTKPIVIEGADEAQSEAIDYRADGRGFLTSGEGRPAALFETACTP